MRSLICIVIIVVFCMGCSKSNPISDLEWDLKPSSEISTDFGILGAYELMVDPLNMTAELMSKRSPSLGQSYLVSGKAFFVTRPCVDCLTIENIGITSEGYIQIGFKIRHPFKPGDPQYPPSGKNRLDLDIFDLALIVHPQSVSPTEFSLLDSKIYGGICPFANGYTRELDMILSDSTACPYFLVVDDNAKGTNTFNEFPMGAECSFSTYFNVESTMQFDLYLTFGFGASAQYSTRLNPFYFNPEFNRKNAWKVEVVPPSLGETWTADDKTEPRVVTVKVWDWQHGVTSVSNPPVNPNDIAFPSNVKSVAVEILGMCPNLKIETEPISGTGREPNNPLIYEIKIANENLLPAGEYPALVKVLDERVPLEYPLAGWTDTLVHTSDGVSLTWHTIPEFATYQFFTALVVNSPECEPMDKIDEGTHPQLFDPCTKIIRDKTEWEAFFSSYNPWVRPPEIDFDNNMVIAVFIGGRGSSGFYVTIDCVLLLPGIVDITYTEHQPGRGCITLPVFTHPYLVITVRKWDGEAVWHYKTEKYDC